MKHISAAAICAATAVSAAQAGLGQSQTITQVSTFDFDAVQSNTPSALTFSAFDTMGGTRTLTAVSFHLEANYTLGFLAENGEDYAIGADDWFVEAGLFNNIEIGDGTLFSGVGSVGYGPLSAELDASDGVSQSGADSVSWRFEGFIEGSRDALPFQIDAFVGSGQLDAEIYPFLSLLIPPPEPYFDLWVTDNASSGLVTLTYSYEIVPAPAGTAVLSIGAALATRRRRAS